MPKVLISDKLSPRAVEIFETRGIEVDNKPGMPVEELLACIGEYDGLAIRSATKVTAEVLEHRRGPKVVAFSKKRRKGYHRTVGHRQSLTRIKISEIKA